jgi:hypothetical protein
LIFLFLFSDYITLLLAPSFFPFCWHQHRVACIEIRFTGIDYRVCHRRTTLIILAKHIQLGISCDKEGYAMKIQDCLTIKILTGVVVLMLAGWPVYSDQATESPGNIILYHGISDASAAVAVGEDSIIVADDENNVLRVYKIGGGDQPVFQYDLTVFLQVEPNQPEADIEGATQIGDRIYWITSHGRNKDGKDRPSRYRFFATTIGMENDTLKIQPVGAACKTLAQQLVRSPLMRNLGLDKATRFGEENLKKKELERLAPKNEGLNIEALSVSTDGGTIYIGFRNPRPLAGSNRTPHALVVPLKNPAAVVESGASAIFSEPILWDLGGLGIRSMEYSSFHKAQFIVAGPHDGKPQFVLYRWSGKTSEQPVLVRRLSFGNNDFTPEALVPFANSGKLLLLSDDGTIPVKVSDKSECAEGEITAGGFCPNKYLTNPNKKTFRVIWIEP